MSVYRLMGDGRYQGDHRPYLLGDVIKVGLFADFSVVVDDVFEGVIDFED